MTENNNNLEDILDKDNNRLTFEVKRALLDSTPAPDANRAFQEFLKRNQLKTQRKKAQWISIVTIAASIALLLTWAPWQQEKDLLSPQPNQQLAKMGNVVYQATNDRQYITLSMGNKTVDLSDAASSKDAGIVLTHDHIIRVFDQQTSNHDDVTIKVPAGQTAKLLLDDGTLICLNAGSQLTFPHHFRESGTREVSLCGEAYFEVTHQECRPFVVNADGMQTKVLGTKFNVRSFKDESSRVSLTEGSVEVKNSTGQVCIKPGETAWLRNGTLEVEPTDEDIALSWMRGDFYFDGQTLREITTEIGRWYNLNVVFASDKHLQEQLHFSASRTAPIGEIVHQLQLIGNAHIEQKSQEQALVIK